MDLKLGTHDEKLAFGGKTIVQDATIHEFATLQRKGKPFYWWKIKYAHKAIVHIKAAPSSRLNKKLKRLICYSWLEHVSRLCSSLRCKVHFQILLIIPITLNFVLLGVETMPNVDAEATKNNSQ